MKHEELEVSGKELSLERLPNSRLMVAVLDGEVLPLLVDRVIVQGDIEKSMGIHSRAEEMMRIHVPASSSGTHDKLMTRHEDMEKYQSNADFRPNDYDNPNRNRGQQIHVEAKEFHELAEADRQEILDSIEGFGDGNEHGEQYGVMDIKQMEYFGSIIVSAYGERKAIDAVKDD